MITKKYTKRKNKTIYFITIIVALTTLIFGIGYLFAGCSLDDTGNQNDNLNSILNEPSENLLIEYIDVGQADSSLIYLPNGEIMLIDAGGNSTANKLSEYLSEEKGIEKIDYLIGTHPHEDHIGGLDVIINNFDIGELYMPKLADSSVPTTKTYNDVLDSIINKNLKANQGIAGVNIINEDDLKIDIIAPNNEKYSDLNNYSIAIKITYGEKSFLFMGDAEELSENEILENGYDVKADVIKCGHHGSHSSSSEEFINAVNPDYAIISCGVDNSYGHPHSETLENFENHNITYYRTDKQGTIYLHCDGRKINITNEK